jgi:hypothetical protein
MKTKTLITVLLISFVVTSCTPKKSQPNPATYLEQTLTVNKCKNPCWLGIEPRMSSNMKDIEEILSQFYGNENVYTNFKASRTVFWRVTNTDFPQHGSVVLDENNQVVHTQIFFDDYYRITVDNLISIIGEPEYVLLISHSYPQGFRCDGIWGILYPKSGLEVLISRTTESIKQSQFIGYIGIEKPSTLDDKHWWSDSAIYKTVQWEGYNNYCVN